MAISDKTRKILWGNSGNKCALCRTDLVAEPTDYDSESIVGEECHIVSGAPKGPRSDSTFPIEQIDKVSNLLLLCRTHHKVIDDQTETYTAEVLRLLKKNHEKWIKDKLSESPEIKPIKITRKKESIPTNLSIIRTGKELANLATNCIGLYQDYEDDLNDDEVEIVGSFLQEIRDWTDIFSDLEPFQQVRAVKSINDEIQELMQNGFLVFAAVENQILTGGMQANCNVEMLHLSVYRSTNRDIVIDKEKN